MTEEVIELTDFFPWLSEYFVEMLTPSTIARNLGGSSKLAEVIEADMVFAKLVKLFSQREVRVSILL